MKLRPKDTEIYANKPESIMAQMVALLSEKDHVIEQMSLHSRKNA
jgi:hypothetical protein